MPGHRSAWHEPELKGRQSCLPYSPSLWCDIVTTGRWDTGLLKSLDSLWLGLSPPKWQQMMHSLIVIKHPWCATRDDSIGNATMANRILCLRGTSSLGTSEKKMWLFMIKLLHLKHHPWAWHFAKCFTYIISFDPCFQKMQSHCYSSHFTEEGTWA